MQVLGLVLQVLVFGVGASFKVGLGVGMKFSNGFNVGGPSFGVDFGERSLIKSCGNFDHIIKSLDALFEFVKVYIRGYCVQPFSDDIVDYASHFTQSIFKIRAKVIQRL